MAKIEFIGNLGADAKVQTVNGQQFVSFNVADSEQFTDGDGNKQERTTWISCTLRGDGGKLLPFLLKGKTVFVRGYMSTRIFNSAKHHMMMAGVNCSVREIELIGGQTREVPTQLNDDKGLIYDIYQAFYLNPQVRQGIKQETFTLYDRNMQEYTVDHNGFVTKVQKQEEAPAETSGNAQTDTNDYSGENAKPF